MVPFELLNQQNHQISELTKVLSALIQDRAMCDTTIFCELFDRFSTKVREHLELEDRTVYASLLTHSDKSYNELAVRSLNGSKEIKRLFSKYINRWCRNRLDIYDHAAFIAETDQMFRLLTERIQSEVEQLYPVARRIEQELSAA